jgi:hypothetical protein
MATGGGDIQKKLYRHTACFTPIEHALLMTQVELAAVSISTYLKCGALDFPLPRAARRPTTNHEDVARLLGELGRLSTAFRAAQSLADPDAAETALRDLSELRLLCFDALGRQP